MIDYTRLLNEEREKANTSSLPPLNVFQVESWKVHNMIQTFDYNIKSTKRAFLIVDTRLRDQFLLESIARSENFIRETQFDLYKKDFDIDKDRIQVSIVLYDDTENNSSDVLNKLASFLCSSRSWVTQVVTIKGGFSAFKNAHPYSLTTSSGYSVEQKMLLSLPTFAFSDRVMIGNFIHACNKNVIKLLGGFSKVIDLTPSGIAFECLSSIKSMVEQDEINGAVTDVAEYFTKTMGFSPSAYIHIPISIKNDFDEALYAIQQACEQIEDSSNGNQDSKPVLVFDGGNGSAVATVALMKAKISNLKNAETALAFALKLVPNSSSNSASGQKFPSGYSGNFSVTTGVLNALRESINQFMNPTAVKAQDTTVRASSRMVNGVEVSANEVPEAVANLQKALQDALGCGVKVFAPTKMPVAEEDDEDEEEEDTTGHNLI